MAENPSRTEPIVIYKQAENSKSAPHHLRTKRTREERVAYINKNQQIIDAFRTENLGQSLFRVTQELERVVVSENVVPESYQRLRRDMLSHFQR